MAHYLPLDSAVAFAAMVVVSRLLTNRYVKKHQAEIIATGTALGQIPSLFSTIYLLGFIGLIVAFFWAFISLAWWAGLIVAGLYLLTGLVPSKVASQGRTWPLSPPPRS